MQLLDFLRRFKLVHKTGQACTALVACISRPNEVLVALADYSLKCIDTGEQKKLLGLQLTVTLTGMLKYPSPSLSLSLPSLSPLSTDSTDVVATLWGHEASVKSLSLHSSGRFALAVSSRDSVLWDLDSFARCRTLNGGQEVGVQDVRG